MPVIRGLVSETKEVDRAVEETKPDALGICVSKEELETLGNFAGQEAEPASAHEEAYIKGLQRFGEVRKPPPCYSEGLAAAKQNFPTLCLQQHDTFSSSLSDLEPNLWNMRARSV